MISVHGHSDYLTNPLLATNEIGRQLGAGCLNLFLGAGVSSGFGLPGWYDLVARILGRDGDIAFIDELKKKSNKDLQKAIDDVDVLGQEEDFTKILHAALYSKIADELVDQLPKSPLLLSVAALLTGSCRGRIQRVFTYNYDDLIEQYLGMLGYSVCVRVAPTDFSRRCDVEVNHVHGFLPQSWKSGDVLPKIVLSERSYRERRSKIDEGWSLAVEHSIYERAGLFLGLSGDDTSMLDIFERTKENIERAEDYHGYWLLTPDAYDRNAKDILSVGMCPIRVEKAAMPMFVFRICQQAMAASCGSACSLT
jgi:hypothetical protein